ncbi:MAG: hypothetical protein P1P88_18460 [Bacteroidales bacterium]|nr:hypothetical protein [Bacteroidales bacterium]
MDQNKLDTNIQIRNQLLRKIYRIPSNKLKELDEFISKLDEDTPSTAKILTFAGSWENLDKSILDELTESLVENRKKNRNRIHE